MAILDSTLQKPKAVIQLGSSVSGIDSTLLFGTIYNIFETSDKFAVGDSVMFDPKLGVNISDDTGSNYFIVNEDDLFLTEPPAPPAL